MDGSGVALNNGRPTYTALLLDSMVSGPIDAGVDDNDGLLDATLASVDANAPSVVQLDPTYGGYWTMDAPGTRNDAAYAVAFDSEGRLPVSGVQENTSVGRKELVLLRYLRSGDVDTSLSGTGKLVINRYHWSRAHTVIPLDDGGILLAAIVTRTRTNPPSGDC